MIWRLLTLLLLAGTALALGAAWKLSAEPRPDLALPPPEARLPDAAVLEELALRQTDASRYPDLVERPLFTPERRTEPARDTEAEEIKASVAPEVSEPAPRLQLLGVLTDRGERVAVLTREGETEIHLLRHGGYLDGWGVEKVDDTGLTLRKGSREVQFLLFEAR